MITAVLILGVALSCNFPLPDKFSVQTVLIYPEVLIVELKQEVAGQKDYIL